MDYDGAGAATVTSNNSINLSPVWSPDTRSLAFTSYMRGYPYLYRMFPFESRPVQVLAGFLGINTSPAFSPDGRVGSFDPVPRRQPRGVRAEPRLRGVPAADHLQRHRHRAELVADRARDRVRVRAGRAARTSS